MVERRLGELTIQSEKVGCNEQLETQLHGNLHVGDVIPLAVPVPVVEVLGYLLEDDAT